MRYVLLLCLLFPAVTAYAQLDVFYTGRTLGYFRDPDQQNLQMVGCPGNTQPTYKPSAEAARGLYDVWQKQKQGTPRYLLVGMGDNFAPELFARTFSVPAGNATSPAPHPGKDRYVWDLKKGAWVRVEETQPTPLGPDDLIPADNVGCFIREMGYAALVPGKHDFYFGPDRLRLMAKFLYKHDPNQKDKPNQHFTVLLAGNLSIATTAPDAKPRQPLYQIEHKLREKMTTTPAGRQPYSILPIVHNDDPSPSITFPDVVLPSYRKIAVDNAFYLKEVKNGDRRVIPGDLIGSWKLSPMPFTADEDKDKDKDKAPTHLGPMVPAPGQLYLVNKDDKSSAPVSVKLRVTGLVICPNDSRDPFSFKPPIPSSNCIPTDPAAKADGDDFKKGRIVFETRNRQELDPDHNYAACMQIVDVTSGSNKAPGATSRLPEYYCQPFYVAGPFFKYYEPCDIYPRTNRPGEPPKCEVPDGEPRPDDPFIVKDVGSDKVAIFGLLDPDLQGKIGRLNYGWWNQNTNYETTAQISAPDDALKQAMMRCEIVTGCENAKWKILLAQMPAAKAAQLLANVSDPKFDLVVAETDADNKTPAGTFTKELSDENAGPRFVVVPDELYAKGKLTYQIPKATVTHTAVPHASDSPPGKPGSQWHRWELTNTLIPSPQTYTLPLPMEGSCPAGADHPENLRCLAIRTLLHSGARPKVDMNDNWSSGQILQRLVMLVMQREQHTDVSLLQTRDLFRPEVYGRARIDPDNLQEILDRLFWKGDYALSVPETGSTLVAIMKASDAFGQQEANPTNVDLGKGRTLLSLGFFKEAAEQNWTVNGQFLDPAKAYAVSMTDFLALGDTGYSQLQTPLVPYPYRIKDFKYLRSISGMVCSAIRKEVLPGAKCSEPEAPIPDRSQLAINVLDLSKDKPSDATPGMTSTRQSRSYLDSTYSLTRLQRFYDGQNSTEVLSAQKRYWSFSLEKGDLGLNVFVHKRYETLNPLSPPVQTASLKNDFAGIPVAQVTAPNSYTLTFDDRARLKHSGRAIDFFLLQESAYAYTRTQDAGDNGYARSLSQNMLAMETGVLPHLFPRDRNPRRLDALLSWRTETQVEPPREDISLAKGTIPGTLRRSINAYGKIGPRYSDERSWVEAGALFGRSFRTPYQFVFDDASHDAPLLIPGCINCATPYPGLAANPAFTPKTTDPFLDWVSYLSSTSPPLINANTKFFAHYTDRPLEGLFLNFSVNIPLPLGRHYPDWAGGKPIAALIENNGNWFFNNKGDLATQTRYFDKLALSIVIPVVGNLSFKPETDLYFYENKAEERPYRGINCIGTFSYTFDWREGQPWSRVWRFASPPPTASVPPSGR